MPDRPPAEVYIGTIDGQWPMQVFEQQHLAISWMQDAEKKEGEHRVHLWLCRLSVTSEMTVLPPSAPRLIPRYEEPSHAQ